MAKPLKMPDRQPFDGPITVKRIGEVIIIEAKQGAIETRVELSEYNAWRAFGCLALLLGIELPRRIANAIHLGDVKAGIGYDGPPKTLGERVARYFMIRELEREGLVVPDDGESAERKDREP